MNFGWVFKIRPVFFFKYLTYRYYTDFTTISLAWGNDKLFIDDDKFDIKMKATLDVQPECFKKYPHNA